MAQCPLGGQLSLKQQVIKSLEKAQEWYPDVKEEHLPVTLEYREAAGGRAMWRVFTQGFGQLLYERG